mgnify:CR=1 FL=1
MVSWQKGPCRPDGVMVYSQRSVSCPQSLQVRASMGRLSEDVLSMVLLSPVPPVGGRLSVHCLVIHAVHLPWDGFSEAMAAQPLG